MWKLYQCSLTSFIYSKAKKSRHSLDTVDELSRLFPKTCDVMGIATPGVVCKFLFHS